MCDHFNIEHCTITDTGLNLEGEDATRISDAINEYLSAFAKPSLKEKGNTFTGTANCLKCGTTLNGALGSFTWGIAHGEGNCGNCGWPCRAYHNPQIDGENIFSSLLPILLQYHPDYVNKRTDDES